MKLPMLKRDTKAKLEATIAEQSAAQAKLAAWQAERRATLTDAEDLGVVHKLDAQIDAVRRTIATCTDRIAALEAQLRRERADQLEKDRLAAINSTIVPALAELDALGRDAEAALRRFIEIYTRFFEKRNDIASNWPASLPRPQYSTLHFAALARLFDRTYASPAHVTQALGYFAKDIAAQVAAETERFLEAVRESRIAAIEDDERTAA
jgi:hypothetical protein